MEEQEATEKGEKDGGLAIGEPPASSPLWRVAVLAICILWSTNFAVIKEIFHAAPTIDPSLYAAIRFSLATLVLLPRTFNSLRNPDLMLSSMGIGLFVFFGYLGQAIGLLTTTANKSAFICSLNVVWVALVSSVIRKEFKWSTWLSALMAVVGVAFLEFNGTAEPPVVGDLWALCQPIGFGTGYVLLEYLMAKYPSNAGAVSAFKLVSIAGASILWAMANGHTVDDLAPILESPTAVIGLLYTGVITTAAAILLQSYAFKNVPATDVSLILASEPVWATIFAAGIVSRISYRTGIYSKQLCTGIYSKQLCTGIYSKQLCMVMVANPRFIWFSTNENIINSMFPFLVFTYTYCGQY
jgi:drug/metabolite transporter (DMT)-like permease